MKAKTGDAHWKRGAVQGKEEVLCRFVFGNVQWTYRNPGIDFCFDCR